METVKKKIRGVLKRFFPSQLPNFLVVGAQKAATTSLHYYLSQHPNIIGSRPKEVRFFDHDNHYEKGLAWYKRNFPNTKGLFGSYQSFEATPEYLYRSYVPERIYKYKKDIKVIIVLRDPVQRAFSAWCTYKQFGLRKRLPEILYSGYLKGSHSNIVKEFYEVPEFPSFEEVAESDILKHTMNSPLEEPSIVRRGIYYPQVKRYVDLFGRSNVLVVGFKDLVGPTMIATLNSILNFLDIESSDWVFLKNEPRNKTRIEEKISPEMEDKLRGFYAEHNDKLIELLEFKPNW